MRGYRIGIIGAGEIAMKRHVPTILAHAGFDLVATAGPDRPKPGLEVPHFLDYRDMLGEVDAVAICTPPSVRAAIALEVIAAGRHVLLEKPPSGAVAAVEVMRQAAEAAGVSVFASWHSQFNAGVMRAREVLAGQVVTGLEMIWVENVHDYHPGQLWLWRAGGFGVFDAGINGLSVLTSILPAPLVVRSAELLIPSGAQTPVAAEVVFEGAGRMVGTFDWRSKAAVRTVAIETVAGMRLSLSLSGRRLEVDGVLAVETENTEYPMMYDHFHALIEAGRSELDARPLGVVADIFLMGHRRDWGESI